MVSSLMIYRLIVLVAVAFAGLLAAAAPAAAHPHVWVTVKSEIVFAPDGAATGVRHAWTFDDMYSAFATQDLKAKVKGQFTREELAPLAEVNAVSLKDYDYFTQGRADGQKLTFADVANYWLEYKDSMLTFNFTLPFKTPVRAGRLNIEIFDPEYFVDFSFAEKNPVALVGAPESCKLTVLRMNEVAPPQAQRLPDAAANPPDSTNYGAQFANRIAVECPTMVASVIESAAAQPLAPPRPQGSPSPPAGGLTGWILAKQAEFYRAMSAMIRAAKADGSVVWGLLGLSFLYGVFHAAGPGHGKAVISSYMVANEETWRRGIVLSFASALLQAIVAVSLVGIAVVLFKASRQSMCDTERVIEIASYALIALVGARLLWVKGRAFSSALFALDRPLQPVGAAVSPPGKHDHHDHAHHHGHDHNHGHSHHGHSHAGHEHHASVFGHAHGPEPAELAGPGGWSRGLSAIVAVGLRPCSGAILILVFALAQGLFWVGVASTFVMALGTAITVAAIATLAVAAKSLAGRLAGSRSGYGMLAMRGIEVAAAAVVLAFGTLLLVGYMAAERGACL
jgi:nickel/cobalt transporter (NicO) family protein